MAQILAFPTTALTARSIDRIAADAVKDALHQALDGFMRQAGAQHPESSDVGMCERAYLRALRERLEWMEARTP